MTLLVSSSFATMNVSDGNSSSDAFLPPGTGDNSSGTESVSVVIYTVLFILGAPPNVCVFMSLLRKKRNLRSKITRLLLHLSVADLIVTLVMIPTEIIWGLTNKWLAGDFLCRLLQIIRALGPNLSSAVLISISIDRYYAIVWPLKLTNSNKRINYMLSISWITSILISLPQGFIFRVKQHPEDPSFTQCIALDFFTSPWQEVAYTIFSLIPLYFAPLLTIIWCYAFIYWAARKRSHDTTLNPEIQMRNLPTKSSPPGITDTMSEAVTEYSAIQLDANHHLHAAASNHKSIRLTSIANRIPEGTLSQGSKERKQMSVSYESASSRVTSKIEDARRRVLRLTVIIIIAFIFCWTPYVLMTLWWQVHPSSANNVNTVVRNVLFLFAVSNSCINPYLYGGFANPFRRQT